MADTENDILNNMKNAIIRNLYGARYAGYKLINKVSRKNIEEYIYNRIQRLPKLGLLIEFSCNKSINII
jgi:hypothetical protein